MKLQCARDLNLDKEIYWSVSHMEAGFFPPVLLIVMDPRPRTAPDM